MMMHGVMFARWLLPCWLRWDMTCALVSSRFLLCRTWAIICLTLAFGWQLYTLWLLVRLHEPVAGATRYSRYMHLATTVFGACP